MEEFVYARHAFHSEILLLWLLVWGSCGFGLAGFSGNTGARWWGMLKGYGEVFLLVCYHMKIGWALRWSECIKERR